jgi:hypothetical protein
MSRGTMNAFVRRCSAGNASKARIWPGSRGSTRSRSRVSRHMVLVTGMLVDAASRPRARAW